MKLSDIINKYHLKDVNFLGELPSQQVHSYLETCDLFVLPSRSEALPRALLEAMLLGKPVIAASVGGIPEIFESGGGLTFPAGDSRMLTRQIVYLCSDRSAAHRLGEIARTTVETRFTFEAFADRMSAIIHEALDPVKM
jgi:glycosyltransferase involved in cell wall biosynthesis